MAVRIVEVYSGDVKIFDWKYEAPFESGWGRETEEHR